MVRAAQTGRLGVVAKTSVRISGLAWGSSPGQGSLPPPVEPLGWPKERQTGAGVCFPAERSIRILVQCSVSPNGVLGSTPLELWGEQDRAPARGGGQAEMAALGLGENVRGCTWVWKEKKNGKEK